MNIDAITGGLIGSILTIALTKVFDLIQKSVEHQHSLQSAYFIKKIEAAETAVINFSNEASKFSQYLAIEEKLVTAKLEDYPFLLKQLEYAREDSKKDSENIFQSLGKIFLYFDVDDYIFTDNENYKKFIEISSEIDKLDQDIKIYSNLLNDFKETVIQDKIMEEVSEKAKAYIPKLKENIVLLNKAREEAFKYLAIVKKDMKKYNP